jgi:hypothetical protein
VVLLLRESRAAVAVVVARLPSRGSAARAPGAALVSPAERLTPGPRGGRRPITFLSGRSRGEAAGRVADRTLFLGLLLR